MIKNDIGTHAGSILTLLANNGKLSIRKIGEYINRRDTVISLALGWLLKENKIHVSENNGELYFEINN